jgi:hypothetical protein
MAACASTMDFDALVPGANDVKVKVRGMVCTPPPLLAEEEMNSISKNPVDLAIAFVAAMAARDNLSGQGAAVNKALSHLWYAV